MNFASFNSLQKLRYFLAGVFPFLTRIPWPRKAIQALVERHPRLVAGWRSLRSSTLGVHAERIAGTFAVGDYETDVVDWNRIPRESIGILRAAVVVATLLCLLVPLAVRVDWPRIPVEAITGIADRGDVGGWAVCLWMVGLGLGWASLLAGAAASSRLAFLPALAVFLYFNVATVAALPKSWWSGLVPLQGIVGAIYCEARARGRGMADGIGGGLASLLSGAGIGFVGMIVIPTAPWFRGRLPLAIVAVGIPLGLAIWGAGRSVRHRATRSGGMPGATLQTVVACLTLAGIAVQIALAVRGGLQIPAQGVSTLAIQMTGYLWPLYYFIGVGVVFKVLRQTRTLQRASQELVPAHVAIPATLGVLLVATLVAWSRPILLSPGRAWPGWIVGSATWLAETFRFIWSTPLTRLTLDTMQWVFLVFLLVVFWGLARRRMTGAAIGAVQVVVLTTWIAVAEYHFEMLGFAHSPRTSAIALFVFVVFVLWLVHRTMSRFLAGDSPWWPQAARIALYGAGLMFVLLPVHARAAMHDPRLTGEIFLYLFQGVLNFGIPYYLYLYAARRFQALPLEPHAALGLFVLGGVLSGALIALDKSVLAGSFAEAWSVAGTQVTDQLAGQRSPPIDAMPPLWWVVLRGCLAMGSVVAVTALVRRRVKAITRRPAATVFAAVAVATGLACFSNRSIELPLLPARVALLLAPVRSSLVLDTSFVTLQLAFILPALVLGLAATGERSFRRSGLGALAAIALHVGIMMAWPAQEAWLRSTGVLAVFGAAGICAFLLLAAAARERLDRVLDRTSAAGSNVDSPAQLVAWPELRTAGVAVLVVCAIVASVRASAERLVARDEQLVRSGFALPAPWLPIRAEGVGAPSATQAFERASPSGDSAHLSFEVRPHTAPDAMQFAQRVVVELGERLAQFTPLSVERWDRFAPGAVAVDFSYYRQPDDSNSFALGTAAIAPSESDDMFVATVTYGTQDVARRWDVVRILSRLGTSDRRVRGRAP